MRLFGIFRNGHRSDEYWGQIALQMSADSLVDAGHMPDKTETVLERAEEYLKFIKLGKALPPL